MKIFNYIITIMTVLATLLLTSCNDSPNYDEPKYPDPDELPSISQSHVVWILMDGCPGEAVKQSINSGKAPMLKSMLNTAIYTFNGIADKVDRYPMSKQRGWATLLSGITYNQEMTDEDFQSLEMSTIFSKTGFDKDGQIAVFGSDESFVNKMDLPNSFIGSDSKIESKAIETFGQDEVPRFSIVQFSDVRKAGDEFGFFDNNDVTDEIKAAVTLCDARIKQIVNVIESRTNYEKESWLVVVASSDGGCMESDGETVYDMRDHNTFVMFYSPLFQNKVQQRPSSDELMYLYYSPWFEDKTYSETRLTVIDPTLFDIKYDPDDIKDYTIQFFYKQDKKDSDINCTVVSKMESYTDSPGTGQGFTASLRRTRPCLYSPGKKRYAHYSQVNFRDGDWHVGTIVFDYHNEKLRIYSDGVLTRDNVGADKGDEDKEYNDLKEDMSCPNAPLTIGMAKNYKDTNTGKYLVTNVQFYDVALPADFIANNYGQTKIDELGDNYPYWDNLIGYWPLDRLEDMDKDVIPDYSKYGSVFGGINEGRSDLNVCKISAWDSQSLTSKNVIVTPTDSYYSIVFNTVDIPFMTCQWLGVMVDNSWSWEGKGHSFPYAYK